MTKYQFANGFRKVRRFHIGKATFWKQTSLLILACHRFLLSFKTTVAVFIQKTSAVTKNGNLKNEQTKSKKHFGYISNGTNGIAA